MSNSRYHDEKCSWEKWKNVPKEYLKQRKTANEKISKTRREIQKREWRKRKTEKSDDAPAEKTNEAISIFIWRAKEFFFYWIITSLLKINTRRRFIVAVSAHSSIYNKHIGDVMRLYETSAWKWIFFFHFLCHFLSLCFVRQCAFRTYNTNCLYTTGWSLWTIHDKKDNNIEQITGAI